MSDYSELKRLAEHHLSLGQAYTVAKPSVLLALIADNERLTAAIGSQAIRRFVGQDDQKKMDELVSAGIQVDKDRIAQLEAERDQLKAENERLSTENSEIESAAITYIEDMQEAQRENARLTELFTVGMTLDGNLRVYGDWQSVRKAQEILAERDQLRAEVAGLRTGYEAYEQVNAELKAEVEELRKSLLDAAEEIDAWGSYASDYFQEKHDLAGCVAKFHAAAMGKGEQP